MRKSALASGLFYIYESFPLKSVVLRLVMFLEGGMMTSVTLRSILDRYHGVSVGEFSYGSLLNPGFGDRGTHIGRYVSVGPNVRRFGAAHPTWSVVMHPFWYNPRFGLVDEDVPRTQCVIGDDVWIGANTVILPGCSRIGIGAVIGAGSVVTKDVPDFAVVFGNPATLKRYRFSEDDRAILLSERVWDLDPSELTTRLAELARRLK